MSRPVSKSSSVTILPLLKVIALLFSSATLPTNTFGFTLSYSPSRALAPSVATRTSSALPAAAVGGSKPNQADFELQELRIQLNAMNEQNVVTSQLMPEKRIELEGYVKRILNRRPSPIPMYEVGKYLPGTKWKLLFSTQSLVADLPKDARISLYFLNDNMMNCDLEFTKTLGLNRLSARSAYSVDSSPVNPGLVTYTYEKITTDVFGLTNIGVGMFGMLSGRSSHIPSAYFDGKIWIETGSDPATGSEYYNVYMTEDEI